MCIRDRDCDIRLPFSSPAKFNGMIDGTVTPIPSRGLTKLKFLTGPFLKLTDRLTRYLRASEQELQDPEFFQKSTTLMFYAIAASLSQIGTHDPVSYTHLVRSRLRQRIWNPCCIRCVWNASLRGLDGNLTKKLSLIHI